VGGIGIKLDLQ